MKYKVGDKVRIVGRKHGHGFNLGDIVEILYVGRYIYKANKNDSVWYIADKEVEPVGTEEENKGSKMLEAGKTYLDVSTRKHICLFTTKKYAYMVFEEGDTSYVWDKITGKSLSLNSNYDIQTETTFKEA